MTNAMITHTTGRDMTYYSNGTADYVHTGDHAPEWLVSAIPGAAEARDAWLAQNESGRELTRAKKAAEKAAPATKLTKIQNGVGATAGPAVGVTYAEWEAGQWAIRDAENAVKAQARRSLAALRKFDAIVSGANLTPEERRQLAAEHALKKHEEAAAAWEIVKAALGERDSARNAAGKPGEHWAMTERNRVLDSSLGSEAKSETLLNARVARFDVASVRRAAAGEPFMSEDDHAAVEQKRMRTAGF